MLEFLTNDHFVAHTIQPTSESEAYWEQYFMHHPEKLRLAQQARSALLNEAEWVTPSTTWINTCKKAILSKIH